MDDGSKDNSNVILDRLNTQNKSIKIFRNETNIGLTRSLNILISKSRGQLHSKT